MPDISEIAKEDDKHHETQITEIEVVAKKSILGDKKPKRLELNTSTSKVMFFLNDEFD